MKKKVRKRKSIPADGIYSGRHFTPAWEPECTFTRGSAYWPLLSIQLESTGANLHMIHIICTYSSLHTIYYAGLTGTHLHHSIRHSAGPCLHFSASFCVCTCINVFDPDTNSAGTKLSSLPVTDVKMSLITRRTCYEII